MDGEFVAKPVAGLYACFGYSESDYKFNLGFVRRQVTARIILGGPEAQNSSLSGFP